MKLYFDTSNISPMPNQIVRMLFSAFLLIYSCFANANETFKSLYPDDIILGESNSIEDQYGSSVAMSENLLIIGAPNDSDNGNLSGAVYVYSRQSEQSNQWILQAQLAPLNPQPGERFGYSVAVTQTLLVIGAPASLQHHTGIGAVYVFNLNQQSQSWEQTARLTADDGKSGDRFGFSLAVSGTTVLIGAFLDDAAFVDQQANLPANTVDLTSTKYCAKYSLCKRNSGVNTDQKQTYVFEKEAEGDPGVDTGSVYVFTQINATQWAQSDKLSGDNSEGGDLFGYQVAIDNNIAVISAPGKDDLDELSAGAAYVYQRIGNSDSQWQQIQFLTASRGKLDDHFGQSVAISNNTIAIGANQKDVGAQNTGSVYIFNQQNSTNHWTETAQLTAPNPSAQYQFGQKLAMQDNLLLVSAYNERNNNLGAVYLFKQDVAQQTTSRWKYADEFNTPSGSVEKIGTSIAFNNRSLAIGAIDNNGFGKVLVSGNSTQPAQQPPPSFAPSPVIPDNGLWWNPQRSGHGLDIKLIGDNLLAIWYTYRQDGTPVWYLASAPYSKSNPEWAADLGLYHWDGTKANNTNIGTLQISFSDETHATMSWTIDGKSGGESIVPFITSSQPPANDFNGTWYEPDKPGYGLTVSMQGDNEVSVLYFYAGNGAPIWALGSHNNPQIHTYAVNTYQGFCPTCPYSEPVGSHVGTITTQFSSPASGRLSTNIEFNAAFTGNWIVNDVSISNLAWNLSVEQGVLNIPSRSVFERLANASRSVGAKGTPEVKFLFTDVNTDSPQLYFINTKAGNEGTYHYDFARDVLKQYTDQSYRQGQGLFSAQAYFSDQRLYLPGSVVAYNSVPDNNNSSSIDIYSIEFWPTDPVSFRLVNLAYQAISKAMPFTNNHLFYHPVGQTHEQLYFNNQGQYDSALNSIFTDNLFAETARSVLNEGEAYGRLRVIEQGDQPPSLQDVAIYRFIPNNLSHIAGIITETPQTPLSHINLKARQNNTPNAYINNASQDPEISPLIGQWVHYQAEDNRIQITLATQQQAEQWLQQSRPVEPQIPIGDLSVETPQRLTNLGHQDWVSFGVKAANVAELANILPDGMVPDGYAVPFALYDQFMSLPRCGKALTDLCETGTNGQSFYQQALVMFANTDFQNNPQLRDQQLKVFRKAIKQARVPATLTATIEAIRLFWEPDGAPFTQSLRVRSSTNNEDLPKFNGAGLYSSFTHKPDEGKLIESIKQVWASLWNSRAYDERQFYRIDHFKTYMGVLVHPNFGDEQANGVSVSKNIYNPNWQGIYTNVQHGEISITNPEPIDTDSGQISPVPDEFIITRLPISSINYDWETQFIRHTNVKQVNGKPTPAGNVLTDAEIIQLRDAMLTIHRHFKTLHKGDNNFAMETEFKITETTGGSRGLLAIKQARPWVE